MNMNTVFIRAAIATAMVGVGLASFDVPHATARETSAISIDATAPLQATLLPTITVVGSSSHPDASATMTAVAQLAHALGKTVTAEGVETKEQCDRVANAGCEFAQGYYFARPMSSRSFATQLN